MISDKAIGTVATICIAVFLAYYTFWLLILPFIRNESDVTGVFPDAYYGLAVPTACIMVLVAVVLSYTGFQLCLESMAPREGPNYRSKAQLRRGGVSSDSKRQENE